MKKFGQIFLSMPKLCLVGMNLSVLEKFNKKYSWLSRTKFFCCSRTILKVVSNYGNEKFQSCWRLRFSKVLCRVFLSETCWLTRSRSPYFETRHHMFSSRNLECSFGIFFENVLTRLPNASSTRSKFCRGPGL